MRKEEFIGRYHEACSQLGQVTKMVVAVKLPTGATELIINSDQIESKIEYYNKAYDDDMKLKNNNAIQIVAGLFA